MTGLRLKNTPVDNPVREAYYKYSGSKFVDLASHDQITVLYGIRGGHVTIFRKPARVQDLYRAGLNGK